MVQISGSKQRTGDNVTQNKHTNTQKNPKTTKKVSWSSEFIDTTETDNKRDVDKLTGYKWFVTKQGTIHLRPFFS